MSKKCQKLDEIKFKKRGFKMEDSNRVRNFKNVKFCYGCERFLPHLNLDSPNGIVLGCYSDSGGGNVEDETCERNIGSELLKRHIDLKLKLKKMKRDIKKKENKLRILDQEFSHVEGCIAIRESLSGGEPKKGFKNR